MDCVTSTQDRATLIPMADNDEPSVAAVRSRLLEGLTTVASFAAALNRSERTIYDWMAKGMPTVYVGRTPFIPIMDARSWLLKPSTRNSPPLKVGRPRKVAA